MRTLARISAILLLGCSTETIVVTPGADGGTTPPEATCTESADNADLEQYSHASGYDPIFGMTNDDDGIAVALENTKDEIVLVRWAADGTASPPVKIAEKAAKPGREGISSIALAYRAGKYFVAWSDFVTKTVKFRIVDKAGVGEPAVDVNPATRKTSGTTYTISAIYPRFRIHEDVTMLAWQEEARRDTNSYMQSALVLLGKDGARLHAGEILPASTSSGLGDVVVVDGTVKVLGYIQGGGSVADTAAVLTQAKLDGDLTQWSSTKLAIPQPANLDVSRSEATLLPNGKGNILVQQAGLAANGGSQRSKRIELVWLNDLGQVTDSKFIEIAPTIQYVRQLQAILDKDTIHVLWADSDDSAAYNPTLHDAKYSITGESKGQVDAPITLGPKTTKGAGRLGGFTDYSYKRGGFFFGMLWQSGGTAGSSDPRIDHVGHHFFCLAAP